MAIVNDRKRSILNRKPKGRRISDRIGALRAMALEPIGDIADVSLTESTATETLTWETATEWDNATSESGVVHESVANTDHSDDTIVKKGHSIANPYQSLDLIGYWPLHEDSGSVANDFSGNANDGNISGPTLGVTGLLGTTAYSFDGTDDYVGLPSYGTPSTYTIMFWSNLDTHGSNNQQITMSDGPKFLLRSETDGNQYMYHRESGNWANISAPSSTGAWIFWAATYDGSTLRLYKNGTETANVSAGAVQSGTNQNAIGADPANNQFYTAGDITMVRYSNAALTASDIQYLYDVVNTAGTLTTATKSFSASKKPDLQNLDYTLNAQSIDLDVIGSPGTASEEVVTQSLGGATSYSLTWANSHTDFRIRPNESTTDVTVTPTFNRGELVA